MMAASSAMAGALRMRMPAEVSCSTTAERTHRCRLGCHVAGLGCGLGKSSLLMKVKRAAGSPSCVRAAMEPQHVEGAKKAVAREPGSFSESASWQSKISQLVPAVPEWVQLGLGETLRFLQRPAVVAMIVAAVLMCTPDFAMAAQGGGRVGGRVSQGSRSYSAPAQTYSAPSTTYIAPSYSAPFFAPSPFFGGWGWSPFYAGPTVVVGGGGGGLGGLFTVVLVGAVLVVVANSVFGFLGGEEEDDVYSTTTSVMKLQVGLLGMARTLQKDLDRIGERADTSSAEGLHYVLTETVLSLLRHPDYCVYGTSMTDIKSNAEAGEARFNSLSLEERGKFREETLVNVGAVQRGSSRLASTDRFTSEYIVVTIIVAADGRVQLPDVNSAPSLREALTILGSVPVDAIQAVEILWTPQRDGDTLSATEMLADYPQLPSLSLPPLSLPPSPLSLYCFSRLIKIESMAAVNLSSSVALLEKSTAAAKGVPSSSSSCSSSSIQGLPVLGRRHAHGRQRPLLVRGSAGKAPARRGAPIRTNAVATAPSTGVATWRSSGTSQAVPPAWSVLSEELSMGPCPRSPRDLDVLLANTKTTALLFLETEDGCDKLGLDWGKFRERASQKGLMAVRISMRDGDYQDQAAALPEAVRAVASLVALGYKVHVCCTSGVDRSPLVALGYLTFVKGMEFTDAVEIISANNQAAQPHFESWEEAKTRMAAGDLKRVSALAHEVAQHRVAAKQPGTPADDWLTAQQLLVAEAFDRGVATDVTLTEAISRVTRLEANRALEELAAFKANAEKAMEAANSSRDRLEFFNRQLQSLKDKEAEARLAMNAAVKDKEGLARQVQTLKLSEGSATKSAAEAREALAAATERVRGLEQREAEARAAAESATSKARDLALQVEKLRHAEAVARKELHGAKAKADFVATKLSSMEASLKEAQRAKDAANDRVKELLKNITSASTSPSDAKTLASKITELSSMETAASAAASIAKERVEFFQRQVIALKEREDATKELAQEALAKVSKLGEELEMTARREASAKEQVALLKTEVAQLSKQLQSLQMQGNTATAAASTGTASTDQTAEVQRLLAELEAAQKKASKATDAATYAQDQVQFFLRRIELLKEKEEKATKQAEERMAAFEARVVGKAQREIAERTAAVVKEMSAEVEAAKKISSKSLEQASTAKEQVQFFQRRMEMLKEREEKSKVATDARIRTFTLQVSELREKLAAADKAAAEADQKITNLSSQVAKLEVKEMAAIEAAKAAGERVHFFYRHIESLKEKEAAAKQAAADAQEQVKLLQKKVEALERKEEVAYAQASKYREKVAAFELSSMELEEELQMVKEREGKLMAALEDGSGVLKIAMEADETTKKLRKEAVKMAAELKDTQIRADRLASELEQALQAAGKKPRHWNDIEKSMFVAKGGGVQEMETQMKSQMTSMTQSMTASGTAVAVSGEADAQTAFLQNLVLGALGAAAVPFTLMSLFSTGGAGNPNVIGAMSQGQAGQTLTEQDAGGPAVEELLAGPIVKGTSPEEFCQTVPSGLRSARTDKFCNTLLEAAAMAE